MSKWNLTSLCSASYVSWQRDTARISCWENACSNRQAAGPATVNPPDGIDGQADKRTDRQTTIGLSVGPFVRTRQPRAHRRFTDCAPHTMRTVSSTIARLFSNRHSSVVTSRHSCETKSAIVNTRAFHFDQETLFAAWGQNDVEVVGLWKEDVSLT